METIPAARISRAVFRPISRCHTLTFEIASTIKGASFGHRANRGSPATMRSFHSLSPHGGSISLAPGISAANFSLVSRV